MQVVAPSIPGPLILEPRVFGDARGFFCESWNQRRFDAAVGAPVRFVQDNHSRSTRGVLRGLHYQLPPHAQGKLVRVVQGRVFDVAVDLRRHSATLGRWVGVELSGDNHRQFWIPPGFAHGFLVLSDSVDFLYKTTDDYAPECERTLRWDDPALAIEWPDAGVPALLSPRDLAAPGFAEAELFD